MADSDILALYQKRVRKILKRIEQNSPMAGALYNPTFCTHCNIHKLIELSLSQCHVTRTWSWVRRSHLPWTKKNILLRSWCGNANVHISISSLIHERCINSGKQLEIWYSYKFIIKAPRGNVRCTHAFLEFVNV